MKKRCAAFIAAMTLLTACSPVPKQELSTPFVAAFLASCYPR